MLLSLEEKIVQLKGPILVLGASGFVGSNLLRMLLHSRNDVFGTSTTLPNWRLEGVDNAHIITGDLLKTGHLAHILDTVKPHTVFNCVVYGAYSFQNDLELFYKTNVLFTTRLIDEVCMRNIHCLIHAGSSSEYGDNAAGPSEDAALKANSHYAVTKAAIANLIYYYGKKKGMRVANLRLYSVYGPYEDSSRLIPAVILKGLEGSLPEFVNPHISRDFIYADDASAAFINAAINLPEAYYGESFNIGSGIKTTIADVAAISREIYGIAEEPIFNAPARNWDVDDWYADPSRAKSILGWEAQVSLKDGLLKTTEWIKQHVEGYKGSKATKRPLDDIDRVHSISAIIACYKDGQAIPEMHERITAVMAKLKLDYEIIFVNDGSPDDSEAIIATITERDSHVLGISHSRNFGSQAAFKSGMEMASKNSCVLMDGDLQDPPEIIEAFVQQWKEGYEVIYGRRVRRDAPFYMQVFYKLFYRIFAAFSYIIIPKDAGDFALMDKKVVECLLTFPERDVFLRGLRAYAGFKQTGVDYARPERRYGRTTNSFFKNIQWAKKGIFSFSYLPLNLLSAFGWLMLFASGILMVIQVVMKYLFPSSAPPGITITLLLITFFGSLNLFAISIVGEYIAKIFEEVKGRPHFIRKHIIKGGNIMPSDHPTGIMAR